MNYLYIYIGEIPEYIKTSINSVLSVDNNSKVFFCSEANPRFKNVEYINLNEIKSELTERFSDLNIYSDTAYDRKNNNLWISSLLRIFYINDFLESTNEKEVVHFDSDVIIYKPFSQLDNNFSQEQLNITELNNDKLIFGYSYIPKYKVINDICEKIFSFVDSKDYLGNKYFKEHPLNEMEIMGKIKNSNPELFNILPDLPYSNNDILFDPATYGQYLGGTDQKPKNWFSKRKPTLDHKIGQEISSKRIKVNYKKGDPSIVYKNNIFKLANLHVHSKNLNKFTPPSYKEYL